MTDRIGVTKSGPATSFYLECDRVGQDINGNFTRLHIYLRAVNGPGGSTGSYFGGSGLQEGIIDGIGVVAGHYGTPFLPSGYPNGAQRWRDGPWQVDIGHNADGSRGGLTLRMRLIYGSINQDLTAWFDDFPTIPRASQPSLSTGTFEAGQSITIHMNRASTGFTHDVYYTFGSIGWTLIASGVNDNVGWTPPMSLLNQIPNAPSGVGSILVHTFSGGNHIGTKTTNYTLTTPASVIPTWTSVNTSEDNTAVSSAVGAYVQNVSKLDYAIVGAAGVYSSTISLQRFSVAGQTVDGATGTTPQPINQSGSVPVTWMVQDSRGRQKSQTSNITVLPYVTPTIVSANVQRALSDGTADPDEGTYARIDLNAVVQSLMNVTQRNVIQIKIYSRERGTEPWTLKSTLNPGGITYNSFTTIPGPFAVDQSYDVRIEVIDRFNTAAFQTSIAVGAVFMHWDDEGLGVGKYRENGVLDVGGEIFQEGFKVLDVRDLSERRGLLDADYNGNGPANVTLMDSGVVLSNLPWRGEFVPWGPRVVTVAKASTGYIIVGQSYGEGEGKWMPLVLQNGWMNYNENVADNSWSLAAVTRTPAGIVSVTGLIRVLTNQAIGSVVANLPVGYRPDVTMIFLSSQNDTPRYIQVETNGNITVQGTAHPGNQYATLERISFPAAGVADWVEVGSTGSGSAFSNGWTGFNTAQFGVPAFWKDEFGFVWFRGLVGGGSTAADNLNIFTLPADHCADTEHHLPTISSGGFGFLGSKPSTGINWKTGTSSSTWVSLGGITVRTSDALTLNSWYVPTLINSWVAYGATFPVPAATRREDGLVCMNGLIRSGTLGSRSGALPERMHPNRSLLFQNVAGQVQARLDIRGRVFGTGAGTIEQVQGPNSWQSWDSTKWVP